MLCNLSYCVCRPRAPVLISVRISACEHMYSFSSTHAHIRTPAHTHTYVHIRTCTHSLLLYSHIRTPAHTHTYVHVLILCSCTHRTGSSKAPSPRGVCGFHGQAGVWLCAYACMILNMLSMLIYLHICIGLGAQAGRDVVSGRTKE